MNNNPPEMTPLLSLHEWPSFFILTTPVTAVRLVEGHLAVVLRLQLKGGCAWQVSYIRTCPSEKGFHLAGLGMTEEMIGGNYVRRSWVAAIPNVLLSGITGCWWVVCSVGNDCHFQAVTAQNIISFVHI
ncbi:hypothetical protein AVEN_22114-1 [Araneus ventricosus]|uniref:Uncharacterized protein n=1 Tax=Araneus ventricosus TaxID=182803 RepID=A0A4Y2NL03_ARAVE|nr:hypothetical protein AVEN_22114-1 [Araneus ventricosus]